MSGAQRPLDPAEQNSAYLVIWIDAATMRIVDAGIYSEATPTTTGGIRNIAIASVNGQGVGFARAQQAMLRTVQTDTQYELLRTMRSIVRLQNEPPLHQLHVARLP